MEKRPFFRAAMAGLGKYCMDGYGRIGVYRVIYQPLTFPPSLLTKWFYGLDSRLVLGPVISKTLKMVVRQWFLLAWYSG